MSGDDGGGRDGGVDGFHCRRSRMMSPVRGGGAVSQLPGPSVNPFWWQSRLYPDSGIGGEQLLTSLPSLLLSYFAIILISKQRRVITEGPAQPSRSELLISELSLDLHWNMTDRLDLLPVHWIQD